MGKRNQKRRIRRLVALLILLCLILVGIQAKSLWVRFSHPLKYEVDIRKYATEYQLDPMMVAAVINVESKFDPNAQSHRGAKGLMQLMDDTAAWAAGHAGMTDYTADRIFEPSVNIRLGCWYLNRLQQQYKGDWQLTLAAYNGGSGNVSKWLGDPTISPDGKSLSEIPFEETESYLKKVLRQYDDYQKLYGDSGVDRSR